MSRPAHWTRCAGYSSLARSSTSWETWSRSRSYFRTSSPRLRGATARRSCRTWHAGGCPPRRSSTASPGSTAASPTCATSARRTGADVCGGLGSSQPSRSYVQTKHPPQHLRPQLRGTPAAMPKNLRAPSASSIRLSVMVIRRLLPSTCSGDSLRLPSKLLFSIRTSTTPPSS